MPCARPTATTSRMISSRKARVRGFFRIGPIVVRIAAVWIGLGLFLIAYGVVFSFGIYYINRLINRGPSDVAEETGGFTASPISAAHEAGRKAMQGG